ncbi:MAG: efflux transporter periplasmic adaptor subunit [Gammaproteobacteria bacterium]|nr:MAG: efflux transporter periplasmic adaptor subunit [Deltaproteobacteria bacterium]PIE48152.1 MAG: efflux transporter periplasmic adaptor subunit [Gammaproteobacteria bacterium]
MKIFFRFLILFTFVFVISGCSDDKITGNEKSGESKSFDLSMRAFTAENSYIPIVYKAVGTIRPKTEARIESQIQAQVRKVLVSSGKKVKKGQLLVLLDDRSYQAKLSQAKEFLKRAESEKKQAKQGIMAAEASFSQADANYKRIKKYYKTQAATARDLEKAESVYLQAKAGYTRAKEILNSTEAGIRSARQQVNEANVGLGYTRVTSPGAGEILKRMVDPGDLALPGKALFVIQTSGSLRIEANVREGLISHVKKGDEIKVSIKNPEINIGGIVEEIVPYADPESRTFVVKAAIPFVKGLYPGMYGKILIPMGKKETVLIPAKAIIKAGQLDLVYLKTDSGWEKIYVRPGMKRGKNIEILSGLNPGDIIGVKKSINKK